MLARAFQWSGINWTLDCSNSIMRPPWKTILQIKWQIIYDVQLTQTIVQIVHSNDRILDVYMSVNIH